MNDPLVVGGCSAALYEKWLELGTGKSHASSTQVGKEKKKLIFMLD